MNAKEDKIFFRNYAIIILSLIVMIAALLMIARDIGIEEDEASLAARPPADPAVNTAPVGELRLQGELAAPPAAARRASRAGARPANLGEIVYAGLCVTCHNGAIPNFPRVGDKAEWAPRIAQGRALLYEHAIVGFTGARGVMPARGGNPALSDEEVRAAVDYMIRHSR